MTRQQWGQTAISNTNGGVVMMSTVVAVVVNSWRWDKAEEQRQHDAAIS